MRGSWWRGWEGMRCTGRPTDGSRDCCATARVLPTCPRACAAPGAHTVTRGPSATGSYYLFLCCALPWRTAPRGMSPSRPCPGTWSACSFVLQLQALLPPCSCAALLCVAGDTLAAGGHYHSPPLQRCRCSILALGLCLRYVRAGCSTLLYDRVQCL